ncbi:MAG: hypothetical protein II037_00425, partial [Bacteroidales bacterium]|nr:hypothetical protein [Bacteroidales bacterium]
KVDNQNKPLENALFGLFDPATYTATSTANDALYTATSDNSGNVRFTNIPLGTYVLCELQAPTGYLTNRDPRTITLTTHGQVHEETLAYTNEPAIGKIIAYKVDENNQPLAGAQFALFPEGTTTFSQANIALDANGDPLTATSTINGNKAEIVFNNVPFGNYILKEMSAPAHSNPNLNYNLALPINISLNENTATLTGGVYVYEIGTAIADTISQGEAAIIIRKNVLGPDDAQLATTYGAGAVFGLFAANETVFTAENALYLSTPVATSPFQYIFATGLGASGNGIPTGNYIIAEITPPVGTYIEPGIWFQSTTLSIATYDSARNVVLLNVGSDSYLGFINIRNRAISGSVTGHKVDETNNNIQGVVFGLFDVNETSFTTSNALYTATTNASGTFTFDDVLYGEYRLVEIQSDINHYQAQYNRLITINTNGQVINVGNIENPLVRGNIKVIKTGANNTPLANAVFGIFAENETNFDTAHAIAVDTTDVNGYITFMGLPVGTYKVVELEAPEGYVLDSTPHTVVMPAPDHQLYVGDTYTYQNTPVEVTISNVRKVGTITGRKVSSGSPLEGAVFGLFDLDGNELDRQTVTASGTNKGRFTFTNVPYPATYVVREITTPTGYTGTFVQTVTLTDATHDINLGNIDNPPYTVNLRGLKVDEHNNPLIGATFGLFKSNETTFTTNTALRTAISDANGYFTFTNVPIGNYIIRELAAPDSTYELDETNYTCEVTANTANNTLVVTVTNHKKLGSLIAHKTGYGEPLEGA